MTSPSTRVAPRTNRRLAPSSPKRAYGRRETDVVEVRSVFDMERGAFLRLCEAVNTPRSLACFLMARENNDESWSEYLSLPFPDPCLDSFPDDYLVSEVMRKNPRLPLKLDTAKVAIDGFHQSEDECRSTNERFNAYEESNYSTLSVTERSLIERVRRIIEKALGPLTLNKLHQVESSFRFGPGATSVVSGAEVLLSKKMTCVMHVTPRLAKFAKGLLGPFWPQFCGPLEIREASSVITVPKSAKTDRTIAIEPHLNIYAQLGIGQEIRKALRRLGLEPDNQGRNRDMARRARLENLATMDLSSASDLISYKVVRTLLPYDWCELLELARTDYSVLDGVRIPLEKFSSMGNGYTWELESLIFYAIVKAVTNAPIEEIGVFGDDLIFPAKHFDAVTKALNFFGFRVNERKSFWQGDFFESCGTDYWRGHDVRPFYFKGEYHDLLQASVSMANRLRIYAHRRCHSYGCDVRFLRAWLYLARKSRAVGYTYLSLGYGDDGLIVNFDEAKPARLRHGHQGYLARVFSRRPKRSTRTVIEGAYLAALAFGTMSENSRADEFVRGSVNRPQLRNVPVFSWYDLGPWL